MIRKQRLRKDLSLRKRTAAFALTLYGQDAVVAVCQVKNSCYISKVVADFELKVRYF